MRALIVASAPEQDVSYVKALAGQAELVICADGGLRHAAACGIHPDIVIGDFDSGSRPQDCAVIVLPEEKDDSDLMYCVREAVQRGAEEITIACASGGRIDHFLGNLSLLEYLHMRGVRSVLCDSRNRVTFHGGGSRRYRADAAYRYVGIVPLDDRLHDVTLCGLKYPLTHAVISRPHMITMSNEPVEEEYTISIGRGRALIVESRD